MSGKKVLISGCGITWSDQKRKTWGNILRLTGLKIIDVGGPAVSNQWILNRAISYVLDNPVDYVVIQLSSLGKLDVEVNPVRELSLVKSDSLRNFTVDGIWPSSNSLEHPSKQMWFDFLYSPRLELQDLEVKLKLLKFYCDNKNIPLLVLKGYDIPVGSFKELIYNEQSLYEQYVSDEFYVYHDSTEQNTVPCLEFQFQLAILIEQALTLGVSDRINKIQAQYWQNKR